MTAPASETARDTAEFAEPPAPGQLVTVRGRQWVASDVAASAFTDGDPTASVTRPTQHLVRLVSVEDDAREEELRVIWELERGARVFEQHALPDPSRGFDDPVRLDAFLDAVRWGAIASADRTALQAPFRSGITIEDYQLDPVVRALSMPRTNLLIADDVGLGKTIEAGLVAQELTLRHRARTMLIVCPASLTLQWRDEMREKFGLEFRIVDAELLRRLRRERGLYVNPWSHYPRLIVSVDWLKRDRPMRLLREFLPATPGYPRAIDCLIVDEVHTCAPSGTGRYAVDSQRTRAVKALTPHCEHRLFLSATPHNGYLESFTALLEMLDEQRFARGVRPAEDQLERVMVRRLKRDLPPRWDGTPHFPERVLIPLEVEYGEAERRVHEWLERYARSRRDPGGADPGGAEHDGAGHDGGGRKQQSRAADFVTTLLKKRLFSSPAAFAETLTTHRQTMAGREPGLEGAAAPAAQAAPAAPRALDRYIERVEEAVEDDAYGEVEAEAMEAARRASRPLTRSEEDLLDRMLEWARQARDRADAKFTVFREWLDGVLRRPNGEWGDERVIVFTEYRDTQRWLHERLIAAGYPPELVEQLYGGMDTDRRERVKNVFQESTDLSPVRVLLATDAASEGISLQRHCHRMAHWEIPWNPNRLEQRNGRVDRHGQRASRVEIYHFVGAGYERAARGSLEGDLYFLHQAAEKVERIREDLGSAGPVIADQVTEAMLGRREELTDTDPELKRRDNARLKVKHDLAQRLERLTGALAGSRDQLGLSPEAVERVVRTGLRLAHRRDLAEVSPPGGLDARCFRLPELPGAWGQARNAGLAHPVTGAERPVTFDGVAAAGRTDVVLLHLGHRLVRMCLRLLRAEIWAGSGGDGGHGGSAAGAAKLSRVTARVVPGDRLRAPVVVAHGRLVVTGGDGGRLHEELLAAGGSIEAGTLAPLSGEVLAGHLDAAGDEAAGEGMRQRLAEVWPRLAQPLRNELGKRADRRVRTMRTQLGKRRDEEIRAVESVLDELRRSIVDALDDTRWWEQVSLFETDSQREQLRRDHSALARRLEEIPEMVEGEADAIRHRYADPTPRWFPAAVTFLVPETLDRGGR